MTNRPKLQDLAPEAYRALRSVEAYLRGCGLEKPLQELVKMRASQINGCAFCLDMHTREARALGETERRIFLLSAWRDSGLFTARERAALAWAEHLTRLHSDGAPDAAYCDLAGQFSAAEIIDLTLAIGQINLWNRICVGTATPPAEAAA